MFSRGKSVHYKLIDKRCTKQKVPLQGDLGGACALNLVPWFLDFVFWILVFRTSYILPRTSFCYVCHRNENT